MAGRRQPSGEDHLAGHVSHAGNAACRGTRLHLDRCRRHARRRDRVGESGATSCGDLRRPRWASAFVNTTPPSHHGARLSASRATSMTMAPINGRRRRSTGRRSRTRAPQGPVGLSCAPGQLCHSTPNAPAQRVCSMQVREAVSSVSPNLPLAEVRTLDEVYDQSMARDVVHAGDAGDCRRDGADAWRIRTLRRDRVRRLAAAARDRHPDGAWRAAARHPRALPAPRSDPGWHRRWRSAWPAQWASPG